MALVLGSSSGPRESGESNLVGVGRYVTPSLGMGLECVIVCPACVLGKQDKTSAQDEIRFSKTYDA